MQRIKLCAVAMAGSTEVSGQECRNDNEMTFIFGIQVSFSVENGDGLKLNYPHLCEVDGLVQLVPTV